MNISYRKVGGLRFVKIGRLTVSWSVSRQYRDLNAPKHGLSEYELTRRCTI